MISMRQNIEYKIFPWGIRAIDFEKTLKNVEKFVNNPQITERVISIMNTSFGIIVWYKISRTLKIMLKKP